MHIIFLNKIYLQMSQLECFGCLNNLRQPKSNEPLGGGQNNQNGTGQIKCEESLPTLGSAHQAKNESEQQNTLYFRCECCDNIFCVRCCEVHVQSWGTEGPSKCIQDEKEERNQKEVNFDKAIQSKIVSKIKIICQQCEEESSAKYCENCGQYLCEKCSFRIHNKGKRAKHTLDDNITRGLLIKQLLIISKDLSVHLKFYNQQGKKPINVFEKIVGQQHKASSSNTLFMFEESSLKELDEFNSEQWLFDSFEAESLKYEALTTLKSRYPFLNVCKFLILSKEADFQKGIEEEYKNSKGSPFTVQVCHEWKKIEPLPPKHERVLSQKIEIKHNKNISNFSNLSAISKVDNQSMMSNEQSDLFESNELSLTVTLNQNQSILMMGACSDVDKDEKEEKRELIVKEWDKDGKNMGHHRIYSIREENSHTSANNISSSTENSIRKRNKRWPIPYFQPLRIPKYERGIKHDAEMYLRELAQKGILMIRREKAEQYLMDPDVSRHFVRNIGEKEIEYVAYIIDFLSVQCLTWVIESIKQDKMTPNEKLIQSRLKESFDLKVNMKLWDSIIKYLQSQQYQQDYFDNTPVRYIPKISVVKYGQQFLLEFEERKWAYQDQELLDQEEEEWKQFKKLITDYFNDHSQITGGRYGCVQYVKLNGPKPLRKCSLGKLSLYVQQAINKGIIRYHKTLLVSNSQNNNNSFCSQLGSFDDAAKWSQMQRQLKIMAIQLALVDMFLEVPPCTQISLAQIPLNLKKTIIFDYTLVELGFPKLKNILNTLADKLILETTKTHISYEITTNGSEAIEKMRRQVFELNQQFLAHIFSEIHTIVLHYNTITLEDLYAQLTVRLGFPFEHKLFQFPDFYQFLLYYCAHFATVQYVGGTLVVYAKFQQYPVYEQHQTHRTTYSHPPNNYDMYQRSEEYSRTTYKKNDEYGQKRSEERNANGPVRLPSLDCEEVNYFGNASTTPKFNSNSFLGGGGLEWCDYLQDEKGKEKEHEQNKGYEELDENHSREMEHIINIIEDGRSVSNPPTVIEKEGPEQISGLLSKLYNPPEELGSFGGDRDIWVEDSSTEKKKLQHARNKSSNEVPVRHNRQYSTAANINAKK